MGAESTAVLQRGLQRASWTLDELWVACVGIGGELLHAVISNFTSGDRQANSCEHDILATALNDSFVDHGQDHPIPMWRDLPDV